MKGTRLSTQHTVLLLLLLLLLSCYNAYARLAHMMCCNSQRCNKTAIFRHALTVLDTTCSTQQGVGTPIRCQRRHSGVPCCSIAANSCCPHDCQCTAAVTFLHTNPTLHADNSDACIHLWHPQHMYAVQWWSLHALRNAMPSCACTHQVCVLARTLLHAATFDS
jgi:hypothetical protein